MPLRTRHLVFVALATSQILTGCTSWQVVPVSPRALVNSAHAKAVRIQEKGGSKYVLDTPGVTGDSLTGTVWHKTPSVTWERLPSRISLAVVDQVAVRKSNPGLTAALVMGFVVGARGALWVIMRGGD